MDPRTPSSNEHVVANGRVRCVLLRRDVTVERCWSCDRLVGFDVDATREIVLCAPDPKTATLTALAGSPAG